ncbi:MAG: glycine oxidase ThiO [Acidobacteriota bacterium]|nr:glycine oxidase ThiO [Acidobacteriota bacterium]
MSNDAVIVGAGVIGCAVACELAREGWKVRLLDRQKPASEATWAAAGMLAPGPEGPGLEAIVPLGRRSLALFPGFVEGIEAASGMHVGFRRQGALVTFIGTAANHEQGEMLAELARFGMAGEPLTGEEARRREPRLNPEVAAAIWMADEAAVDNRALGRALSVAASRLGVELQAGVEVQSLILEGKRCRGVVAGGERLPAGHVVIAAGCYSAGIEHVPRYAPTSPARGQMVALDAGPELPGVVIRFHRGGHLAGYLVPREDGRLIAGSTLENAGFDKSQTPGGLRRILAAAVEMIPGLENAPIIETWSGLRPDTPDHLPILGPTDIEGLSIATGHHRNGILLAPITARLARQWMLGQPTDLPLEPFLPSRFARWAAH